MNPGICRQIASSEIRFGRQRLPFGPFLGNERALALFLNGWIVDGPFRSMRPCEDDRRRTTVHRSTKDIGELVLGGLPFSDPGGHLELLALSQGSRIRIELALEIGPERAGQQRCR